MPGTLTQLFPLWAMILSIIAYTFPDIFIAMQDAIFPLLVIIMFSMGITLTPDDFKRVLKRPSIIGTGVIQQYTIMPLAAYVISKAFKLPEELFVGMMLVGCSSGGTASNIICYLAKANVALSITLTLVSTLLAIIALPGLTWLYIGQSIPVPVAGMIVSILKLVVLPVLLGVMINSFLKNIIHRIQSVFPFVAMLAIVLVIAIVVSLNHTKLSDVAPVLIIAVIAHNLTGLLAGYTVARLLRYDVITSRTLAIEAGMQNSGLSVALAAKHFTTLAALPGAIFSIWHNLSGSLLAGFWSRVTR